MIIPFQYLEYFCQIIKENSTLIVTNGNFDCLHRGHVKYLKEAKSLGGILLVGINSDKSIKKSKGEYRPINKQEDRAYILNSLDCVDYVTIFSEKTATTLIDKTEPDIYVKGGNYTFSSMNQDEKQLLNRIGCEIKLLSLVEGYSSSNIIKEMQEKKKSSPYPD